MRIRKKQSVRNVRKDDSSSSDIVMLPVFTLARTHTPKQTEVYQTEVTNCGIRLVPSLCHQKDVI